MTKPISRQLHGFADYTYVPIVAALPDLAGFENHATPALLCKLLSTATAGSAFCTRAEWGFFKKIPFKTHLALDIAVGIFAISAPWMFGFARNKRARNSFLAIGATGILAGLLTDDTEML